MKATSDHFDTVIVGAGAAGLVATNHLTKAGQSICLLEGRDRVGGRILTLQSPDVAIPLELGAEFIHGESPSIFERLRQCGEVAVDAPQKRWQMRDGHLQSADAMFEKWRDSLKRVGRPATDCSFSEFINTHRRAIPAFERSLACMIVEGFDAADPARASAIETLKEWRGRGAADAPTFRPQHGYGALIDSLATDLDPHRTSLRLGAVVSEIRWGKRRVITIGTRSGEPFEIHSRQAIIALPLGVLQLPARAYAAVRFTPPLGRIESALSRLAVGPVIKVILRFNRPFWTELQQERYREATFFHCADSPFPTFWTSLPLRTPLLVAWSAGPKAARMANADIDERLRLILGSLATLFGRTLNYRNMLENFYCHDWQRDPFARGAYSYSQVRGGPARTVLAQPVEKTLFFAGEASDKDESGAVGGALESGKRAARQLLETS